MKLPKKEIPALIKAKDPEGQVIYFTATYDALNKRWFDNEGRTINEAYATLVKWGYCEDLV